VALLLLCILLTVQTASAHGDDRTLVMAAKPVGPYTATIWTAPSVMRPGDMHVDVLVFDADERPLLSGDVTVTILSADGRDVVLRVPAMATVETGIVREARFRLEEVGDYRVEVTIRGAAGAESVAFDMQVIRVPLIIQIGIYLVMGLALVVLGLLVIQGLQLWRKHIPATWRQSPA
jgi:hypothetical protein